MTKRYFVKRVKGASQTIDHLSFAGGMPIAPVDMELPLCRNCGKKLTFFFQMLFPEEHAWRGMILSVFQCTECVDENLFIPPMLPGPLAGINVPTGFLDSYQQNFRICVYSADQMLTMRSDYDLRIEYEEWVLEKIISADLKEGAASLVDGRPEWLLDDETPGLFAGQFPFAFLMQLEQGLEFPINSNSPGQMTLGLDRKPKRSKAASYRLFLANQLYFFGSIDNSGKHQVYVLTQRN